MITNFDEQLAIDFDVESAIFIQSLAQWTRRNAANNHNFHEGRYWSFNTYDALTKIFPYWSKKQIERLTLKCINHGLMLKGNFNQKKYDKTCWYSLTDKALMYFPYLSTLISSQSPDPTPEIGNATPEIGLAIPEDTTTSSNNTITTNSGSKSKSKEKNLNMLREMIDSYREAFPNNPQPHPKLIATSLQKTLLSLIKRWPEADPEGKPFDIVGFKRYLHGLKTLSPKFSLGEYETTDGNKKKNGMETFCRWNTFVKFLEGQYS
jgi:hypothetical protein